MKTLIRKYNAATDAEAIRQLMRREGEEWRSYWDVIDWGTYRQALAYSLTYVAEVDGQVCGFSRSFDDAGIYLFVIDLLVDEHFRYRGIGRRLLECVQDDFPERTIFVLSDVDDYYEKLGYEKEGSVYRIIKK